MWQYVNLQIVGQVVLLQRVGLEAMRHFVKIFASNSTYETLGLEKRNGNVLEKRKFTNQTINKTNKKTGFGFFVFQFYA